MLVVARAINCNKLVALTRIKDSEQAILRKEHFFGELDIILRCKQHQRTILMNSVLKDGLNRIEVEAKYAPPARIPSPPTSLVLLPMINSNNFSLTFSHLIENGESLIEEYPQDFQL